MDGIGEAASLFDIGLAGLTPDHVRVGSVGETAGDGRVESALDAVKPSLVRPSPVRNGASAGSMSLVIILAPLASVRAMRMVGTLQTSAARRAR